MHTQNILRDWFSSTLNLFILRLNHFLFRFQALSLICLRNVLGKHSQVIRQKLTSKLSLLSRCLLQELLEVLVFLEIVQVFHKV